MKYKKVQNFIDGKFAGACTTKYLNVISPIDGAMLSSVPLSSVKDLNDAVSMLKSATPPFAGQAAQKSNSNNTA